MRQIRVDALKGNEILARAVFSQSGTVLMAEGTVIKSEYISHLQSLRIETIYVEDDLSEGVETSEGTERKIKEECQEEVKKIIDRFSCCGNAELQRFQQVASTIIMDILKKKEIVFVLEGIRNHSDMLYSHPLNVCAMSVFIALKMGMAKKKIINIAEGCLLHDIGFQKVYLERDHLESGKFTEKEEREIKKHVVYGYEIVQNEKWLSRAAKDIILHHHERWNGSGYPMRLKEERISIENRIVAACDEFDCMAYGHMKEKIKIHRALAYLKENAGILFDKKVIDCMMENVAAYPNGTIVKLNNKESGIVLRQDEIYPNRPVVRLLIRSDGTKYENWCELVLANQKELYVEDTVDYI